MLDLGGVAWGTVHAGHAGQSSLPAGLQGALPDLRRKSQSGSLRLPQGRGRPQNGAPAEFKGRQEIVLQLQNCKTPIFYF